MYSHGPKAVLLVRAARTDPGTLQAYVASQTHSATLAIIDTVNTSVLFTAFRHQATLRNKPKLIPRVSISLDRKADKPSVSKSVSWMAALFHDSQVPVRHHKQAKNDLNLAFIAPRSPSDIAISVAASHLSVHPIAISCKAIEG
jgi:hypothetical protein